MKGRVSYHQLNVAVQSINAALSAKYKILHQGAKTLSNQTRKLQQRFKSEETKETKGTPACLRSVCLLILHELHQRFKIEETKGTPEQLVYD